MFDVSDTVVTLETWDHKYLLVFVVIEARTIAANGVLQAQLVQALCRLPKCLTAGYGCLRVSMIIYSYLLI